MNKAAIISTLLICFLSACNQSHSKSDYWNQLPQPKGWVNDFEDLYTDGQEHILDSVIRSYNSKVAVQLTIITIDSTNISREHFDSLIFKMANKWGVGESGKDNGIVIGISKAYRQIRIENGLGIAAKRISDKQTSEFIEKGFLPNFQKEHYFEGTIDGLNAIFEYLSQATQSPK